MKSEKQIIEEAIEEALHRMNQKDRVWQSEIGGIAGEKAKEMPAPSERGISGSVEVVEWSLPQNFADKLNMALSRIRELGETVYDIQYQSSVTVEPGESSIEHYTAVVRHSGDPIFVTKSKKDGD